MKLTLAIFLLAGSLFAADPVSLSLKDFTAADGGAPGTGWSEENGVIQLSGKGTGLLLSKGEYASFELEWEWKLAEGGNNGIKYCVTEERPAAPGYEYQMIDDARHSDARRGPLYQTAAFYDVLPPAADKPLKEAGEWNSSRLVVKGTHVEHWLNGKNVLTYDLGSPEVKAGVARSKFKSYPGFGDKIAGPIMLTYHQDECWFRNMKLRELK